MKKNDALSLKCTPLEILSGWGSLPALKFKMKKRTGRSDVSAKAHGFSPDQETPVSETLHRKIQNIKLRGITSDLTMRKDNIE